MAVGSGLGLTLGAVEVVVACLDGCDDVVDGLLLFLVYSARSCSEAELLRHRLSIKLLDLCGTALLRTIGMSWPSFSFRSGM